MKKFLFILLLIVCCCGTVTTITYAETTQEDNIKEDGSGIFDIIFEITGVVGAVAVLIGIPKLILAWRDYNSKDMFMSTLLIVLGTAFVAMPKVLQQIGILK